METDPIRALWQAMQKPNAPQFTFEELESEIGEKFHWLDRYFPAEFEDFLSLVAVNVLEISQNPDNQPLTFGEFKKLVGAASYQIRKSFEHIATTLPDLPDDAPTPQDIFESKDFTAKLTLFLTEHFTPSELASLEIILSEGTRRGAELLGIHTDTFRKRRQRLLERLRAFYGMFPRE